MQENFEFQLEKPIKIHGRVNGKTEFIDLKTLYLKAPTYKHRDKTLVLKQVYLSAEQLRGMKIFATGVHNAFEKVKNEITKESSDDESVRKKFNTYKFEDHKEEIITLLNKIATVCVETVKLRNELREMEWGPQPKLKFTKISNKNTEIQKKTVKSKEKKSASKKKTEQVHKTHKLDSFT